MVDTTTSRSVRGLLAVIAIFALGIVFGVALSFVIVHHFGRLGSMGSRRNGPVSIERMTRKLDLDDAQQERVRAILDSGHAKMRGVLDETRHDIRAVLRSDQQEKFDRIRPPVPPR